MSDHYSVVMSAIFPLPSTASFLLVHFLSSCVNNFCRLMQTTVSLVLNSTQKKRSRPIHRRPTLSVLPHFHLSFYTQQTASTHHHHTRQHFTTTLQ